MKIDEMSLLRIPARVEPIDFVMDPQTDDLIHGDSLQEGMVVLIEGSIMMENPDRIRENEEAGRPDPYSKRRMLESNYWCMVTDLRKRGEIATFIGLYADGTKWSRTYNMSYCWYVRNWSEPV